MLKQRLQNFITSRWTQKTPSQNDDQLQLQLLSYVAVYFCLFIHIYLLILFACLEINLITYINTAIIALYLVFFFLLRIKKYNLANFLLSLEVIAYTTMLTLLIGGVSNYVIGYYLLILIMQVIVPYGNMRLRGAIIILSGIFITGCLYCHISGIAHVLVLSEYAHEIFMISNIYILVLGTVIQLFIRDIIKSIIAKLTDTRLLELEMQAYTDPLTGLYNRRYADIVLKNIQEKREESEPQHVVALLDIDDFKHINDVLGHQCGDTVLRHLANFLLGNLRKTDIIFRWGGEEFLILIDDIDLPAAYTLLDKLRLKLSHTDIPTEKGKVRLTVTIGAAELNPQAPFQSIDDSDKKMYYGKSSTKNMVVI